MLPRLIPLDEQFRMNAADPVKDQSMSGRISLTIDDDFIEYYAQYALLQLASSSVFRFSSSSAWTHSLILTAASIPAG
jgi:hypothetical protein